MTEEFSWDEIKKGDIHSNPIPDHSPGDEFTPLDIKGDNREQKTEVPTLMEIWRLKVEIPILEKAIQKQKGMHSSSSGGLPEMDGMYTVLIGRCSWFSSQYLQTKHL